MIEIMRLKITLRKQNSYFLKVKNIEIKMNILKDYDEPKLESV